MLWPFCAEQPQKLAKTAALLMLESECCAIAIEAPSLPGFLQVSTVK
jgi:hypothetical protein